MARWKITPRKNIAEVITPREWARRFRTFDRDWSIPFGEFLAKYFVLWQDAKEYVTDYEASESLVDQVPRVWRQWADEQMSELIFQDSVTCALRCHFPNLVRRLFDQWIMHGKPPESPVASPSVSHKEPSNHVCSEEDNVPPLQPTHTRSPCGGDKFLAAGPSTIIVSRREMSSDELGEVPRARELARKKEHDSGGSAPPMPVCGKHNRRVIQIDDEEDPID